MNDRKSKILDSISQFFMPAKCMFCMEILQDNVCPDCSLSIKSLQFQKYNMTIYETYTKFKGLESCVSFYDYRGLVRDAILNAKFKNCASFTAQFLEYIPIDLQEFMEENKVDIVVSAPAHKSKFYNREFDLPQEMAKKIAKKTNIEYNSSLVEKTKKTQKQHNLHREERKTNLKDAFSVKGEVTGKNILIIDDILTTGHTLDEVATALKTVGAAKIIGMTFAYNEYKKGKGKYGDK